MQFKVDSERQIFEKLFSEKFIFNQQISGKNIHTHNWLLQPFSHDYGLISHVTHVVRVNFIRE